jgi:hypothetical protein
VLSGRGLCDELITCPEETYRLCSVVVWSRNLVNEEALACRRPQSRVVGEGRTQRYMSILRTNLIMDHLHEVKRVAWNTPETQRLNDLPRAVADCITHPTAVLTQQGVCITQLTVQCQHNRVSHNKHEHNVAQLITRTVQQTSKPANKTFHLQIFGKQENNGYSAAWASLWLYSCSEEEKPSCVPVRVTMSANL